MTTSTLLPVAEKAASQPTNQRDLRVLFVHNRYILAGGEDQALESEVELFTQFGQEVSTIEEQTTYPGGCSRRSVLRVTACGPTPGMQEIVHDGRTGLHFTAGDPDDLARKVEWAWSHPRELERLGLAARAACEEKYTAKGNFEILQEFTRA
jgi:hypothetical protein